nr:NADH dehydrogenase subunit 4 [Eurycercus lamellatus]
MLKFGLLSLGLLFMANSWVISMSGLLVGTFLWIFLNQSYNFGVVNWLFVDSASFLLISLSFWVTFLMILMSFYIYSNNEQPKLFMMLSGGMLFFLLLTFSTSNLLMFYIAFEATLIPIFLMVLGWGYQPERYLASLYLLFYTLAASLPLLLSIFYLNNFSSSEFGMLNMLNLSGAVIFWMLLLAFMVKMPLYLVHLWLPKAHVEAPVAGSMMLAGVLLKLGGYGMLRVMNFMFIELKSNASLLISVSLLGGMFASLICLRQTDAKALVAYSSVAHMALVMVGLTMDTYIAVGGAIIIMVAHGICSSGLFALVGLVYSRLGTRSISLLRSSISTMPLLTLWWFLFSVSNMGAPPTPNLVGEIYIFLSSMNWLSMTSLFVGLLSFMGAAFSLYLFSATQHGSYSNSGLICIDGECREHLNLMLHFFSLIIVMPMLINLYV